MTNFESILIGATAIVSLLASTSAFSATSYQEVVETRSAEIRASEIATPRSYDAVTSTPYSFQDVIEVKRVAIRVHEMSTTRSDSVSTNVPTSYQDVINNGNS